MARPRRRGGRGRGGEGGGWCGGGGGCVWAADGNALGLGDGGELVTVSTQFNTLVEFRISNSLGLGDGGELGERAGSGSR